MINALVQGKLHGDPLQRTAKNGKPFATVLVRVPLDNGDSMLVSAIAFDLAIVKGLMRLSEGDAVCLSGQFSPKVFMTTDNEPRPSADLVAHGLLTAYHVKRKRGK